ncbi:hypothetical protein M0804_008752 [Polistes exclamans]|nr:hypothetical protein M0804_008752 [Polistes exclamans]
MIEKTREHVVVVVVVLTTVGAAAASYSTNKIESVVRSGPFEGTYFSPTSLKTSSLVRADGTFPLISRFTSSTTRPIFHVYIIREFCLSVLDSLFGVSLLVYAPTDILLLLLRATQPSHTLSGVARLAFTRRNSGLA